VRTCVLGGVRTISVSGRPAASRLLLQTDRQTENRRESDADRVREVAVGVTHRQRARGKEGADKVEG
jgi:hypothetical protein